MNIFRYRTYICRYQIAKWFNK